MRICEGQGTLRTSDDTATIGSNINTCHGLFMSLEFIGQGELVACSLIKLHIVLPCNGQGALIA